MPGAKSMQVRREIIERCEAGESQAGVARAMKVSYGMVWQLWKRYREQGRIAAQYEGCGASGPRYGRALYEQAVALKAAHRGWGAGLIQVELAQQHEGEPLPSRRTLQRWFRREGVARPRPDRTVKPSVKRGQEAHEVWAMDAKEQILLADGSYVSWLTITDEGSGAILAAVLFPPSSVDTGRAAGGQTGHSRDPDLLGTTRTYACG
jgi:hypothetical protein